MVSQGWLGRVFGEPGEAAAEAEAVGRVRLRTLVLIRWFAVAGQALTLLGVHFGFGFALPIGPALATVALSALFNVAVSFGRPAGRRLSARAAALHLGYDILQLSALLMMTGGLENPFAVLILAPVIVSATVLPRQHTIALGFLTGACLSALAFLHLPVPLDEPFRPPLLYVAGIWEALILATLFIGVYVGSVTEEARRMSDALAASQMALAREQRLSALGALAAAAAHELGSPLGTIAITAREMARHLPPGSPLAADVELLIGQSDRCNEILAGLARRPEADGGPPFARLPVSAMVEAAAEPHQHPAIELVFDPAPAAGGESEEGGEPSPEPVVARRAEIIHGLGNLIQNAVQHGRTRAVVATRWSAREITVTVSDDGPGFPPIVRDRLGEPYLSHDAGRRGDGEHMGLGIFIARTLLGRTGARISFANRPGGGAEVTVSWPRARLEVDA